ncbi:uncharacterized protein LOC142339377 [Convolutriloba macropyga]|uniref:uncharacterized protein LOC142339377 n=1 Tax=Convolutriloba macropyga TaxID=536237 RepID=UPI003F526227
MTNQQVLQQTSVHNVTLSTESVGDFSLSIKRIADFVESSYAENYNCSLFDEDSVWGVLLAECHVPNTLSARKACYASYVAHLQQMVSIAERCYPFVPQRKPIQDDETVQRIPPKCGCRYIPSGMQEKCRLVGGHTHCPTCRLVVPYSSANWQYHVIDVCTIPREEHMLLNLRPSSVFDISSSGSVIPNSNTSQQHRIHICFACTKLFRDAGRLKRHFLLNHAMEANIDFKVAHQIDPIRGLFAVINYGDYAMQVTYFIKQYNCVKCYVCPSGEKMKSCPHIIAVLQNSYPVEEYTVSENALAQMPIDIVNRYRNFDALANRLVVPAIIALKTPPHLEASIFSVLDEDNLLKRFTVVVLSSKRSICSCASKSSVNCWHKLLVNLSLSDTNKVSKCCFNLTEMKTFLDNCKLSVTKSTVLSYVQKNGTPIADASKLVMDRLNFEIDSLQTEVQLLRNARIARFGEYIPEDQRNNEKSIEGKEHPQPEMTTVSTESEEHKIADIGCSDTGAIDAKDTLPSFDEICEVEVSEKEQEATQNSIDNSLQENKLVETFQLDEVATEPSEMKLQNVDLKTETGLLETIEEVPEVILDVEVEGVTTIEIVQSEIEEVSLIANEDGGHESSDSQSAVNNPASPLRRSKRTAAMSSVESGESPVSKKQMKSETVE